MCITMCLLSILCALSCMCLENSCAHLLNIFVYCEMLYIYSLIEPFEKRKKCFVLFFKALRCFFICLVGWLVCLFAEVGFFWFEVWFFVCLGIFWGWGCFFYCCVCLFGFFFSYLWCTGQKSSGTWSTI